MYVVVQHRISDPEQFFGRTQEVIDNAPSGVQPRQAFPNQDGSRAVCLWEADSVDSVRDYVDGVSEGIAENDYFEVNSEQAIGLPQTAGASA
jgi:hypothetical protein